MQSCSKNPKWPHKTGQHGQNCNAGDSLKCTAQQDKLGKNAYEKKDPIYIYKNGVEIPPIGYVDDVLTVAKCGNKSVVNNAIVNSFTESKKLRYGADKCKQMHGGKSNNICPTLKVHEGEITVSDKETYTVNNMERKISYRR